MTEPVIQTTRLRKQFGSKVDVDYLSLTVGRGEVFGFLGERRRQDHVAENAAGPDRAQRGVGRMLGRPIGDRQARSAVGFLPEHFRFHEWLSGVSSCTSRPALRHAAAHAPAPMSCWRASTCWTPRTAGCAVLEGMLSGSGSPRRCSTPEVVFLDEPTSGLDPLGRLLVRDLIRELREREPRCS
jgi:ABC-2 type transport system ATP-binding protein